MPSAKLQILDYAVRPLLVMSVAAYFYELHLHNESSLESPPWLLWFERFCACCFSLEYIYRLCRGGFRYTRSPIGIIDLISVVPFWLGFFVPREWLSLVRTLRIARLLKWFRYSASLQLVAIAFHRAWPQLRALLFVFGVIFLLNIALVYECERHSQPEFATLSNCAWYVIVTSSTVGYGDIAPVTKFGRAVISVTLFIPGLAIFAAALGTIGSSFAEIHAIAKSRN